MPSEQPQGQPQPSPSDAGSISQPAEGDQQNQPAVAASSGVVVAADGGGNTVAEGAVQPEVGKLAEPDLDSCPSCKQGKLYVIAWDGDASHEAGQALYAPQQKSGGAAHRKCFYCEYGDTVAINPSPAPSRPVL